MREPNSCPSGWVGRAPSLAAGHPALPALTDIVKRRFVRPSGGTPRIPSESSRDRHYVLTDARTTGRLISDIRYNPPGSGLVNVPKPLVTRQHRCAGQRTDTAPDRAVAEAPANRSRETGLSFIERPSPCLSDLLTADRHAGPLQGCRCASQTRSCSRRR